jgi:hypothetical protein
LFLSGSGEDVVVITVAITVAVIVTDVVVVLTSDLFSFPSQFPTFKIFNEGKREGK